MIGVTFKGDETIIKSDQHVYQWDTGQKIMVSGLGNSSINQVHFSFNGLKTAYPVNVTNSSGTVTVNIPNIVLRYGKDVYMYLCIKNTNGTVVTIKTVIIPVIKRNMPENYMYDDNETVAIKLDELQTEIQRSTAVDTEHENRITTLEESKIISEPEIYIYNRNHGTLSFKENVVFDPSTFTIKFPVGYMRYRANTYNNISAQTLDLTEYETSYNAWDLFFSIKNQNIYARNWQSITETQDVYIGRVYNNHIYINGVSDKYITVKGVDDKPTTTKIAYLTITDKVVYDVASKKLTIPAGYIKYNTNTYWAYSGQTIIFPYSNSDAWNIYYSLTNKNIYVIAWNALITNGDPYLGAIYNDNININGVSFDNVTIKKKSVYFFGDSITGGTHSTAPYHYLMSSAICIKGLNYGIGGTGFVNTVTGTFITGNGVEGVGADVQQNGNNTIKEVMESVGDFSYCSIFAGTNDFGSNVPLDTFRTAVENTLDYALSVTPYVAVSTPIKRIQTTNNIGKTLEEYVKIIKNCCEERGIICFDAYNESGLNPTNSVNRATFYTDGLHLSDKGHLRFARFYREYILKITG